MNIVSTAAAWLAGLLRTRTGRVIGMVAGIALAVGLLADLGAFIQLSAASMTTRAISTVPVDWQVQLVPGASAEAVGAAIDAAAPTTQKYTVGYADVTGFEFTTASGTQSTGAGQVVGLNPSYARALPWGFRMLEGDASGVVLLQQTAANLHAVPGDSITIHRPGGVDAKLTISGIVDLRTADTFFQAVGVPAGAAPQAPPDNAALMPLADWHSLFDAEAALRPQNVRIELHAVLDHAPLPPDPNDAYRFVLQAGHNLEARVAGSALLANNLAAQLDATRGDALYARVLFLFLGAPGVVLAGLLTVTLALAGAERRRRDQSLLRLRGAPLGTMVGFAGLEALATGIAGAVIGPGLAALTAPLFGQPMFGPGRLEWSAIAILAGLLLASGAVILPALASARTLSIAASRRTLGADAAPLWERLYLDLICLAVAALVFWQTAAGGYQVVLATEGVTAVSVDYTAFLAPLLLWAGIGLLTLRLTRLYLRHARNLNTRIVAIASPEVAPAVAASLTRQRRRLSTGVALAALAIGFAVSTGIFNTTYEGQARVDALLTNGADVTVSGTAAAPASAVLQQLRAIPGVTGAEPMQHRFAYVGTDLQDLYGIDPTRIGNATTIADAYFRGGDAKAALGLLSASPDAVLVSDETVTDFQLVLGDTINLRLAGADGQYHPVPFKFAGVVREFPTAPRDSFIVANASYVAKATGLDVAETALLQTSDPAGVKAAATEVVKAMPGVKVTDLNEARHVIGSSLTAVDLAGLTTLELSFAVLLALGATGLVLALGLADRRRGFAILTMLGARPRQIRTFIISEALVILVGGVLFGTLAGWLVAQVLVTVLQGAFDPPPEALSVPWLYLAVVAIAILVATAAATMNAARQSFVEPLQRLRELQ
jgi:putative ABC transport system permease protein